MFDNPAQSLVPAAQYLRMSKEHQRYSIRNQARAISAYAGQHGFTVVKTYTDPGESGLTLRERPGLQALLADVIKPSRPFERVLVLDVSRWGRFQNLDQSGHYEFICFEAGVSVIYCAELFDNDGTPVMALLKQIKRLAGSSMALVKLRGRLRTEGSRQISESDRRTNEQAIAVALGRQELPAFISKGTSRWRDICRAYGQAAAALDATGISEDRTLAGDVRGFLAMHIGMSATPEVFAARHAEAMSRESQAPKVDPPDQPPRDRGRTR